MTLSYYNLAIKFLEQEKIMLPSNCDYKINLTQAAFNQISLIQQNDYTFSGLFFRLKIGGKGCDGFTYDTGFSEKLADDIVLDYSVNNGQVTLIVDPFTAFYCKEGQLDFLLNPKNNEDGFVFINDNEHVYAGKFFKDESMVPRELDREADTNS